MSTQFGRFVANRAQALSSPLNEDASPIAEGEQEQVVAIFGAIASGKTTVRESFERLHDADVVTDPVAWCETLLRVAGETMVQAHHDGETRIFEQAAAIHRSVVQFLGEVRRRPGEETLPWLSARGLVHDLRSPLNTLAMGTSVLRHAPDLSSDSMLDRMSRAVHDMALMMDVVTLEAELARKEQETAEDLNAAEIYAGVLQSIVVRREPFLQEIVIRSRPRTLMLLARVLLHRAALHTRAGALEACRIARHGGGHAIEIGLLGPSPEHLRSRVDARTEEAIALGLARLDGRALEPRVDDELTWWGWAFLGGETSGAS